MLLLKTFGLYKGHRTVRFSNQGEEAESSPSSKSRFLETPRNSAFEMEIEGSAGCTTMPGVKKSVVGDGNKSEIN